MYVWIEGAVGAGGKGISRGENELGSCQVVQNILPNIQPFDVVSECQADVVVVRGTVDVTMGGVGRV
jgi:NADH:ubiquinone oxidoreductase subunit D